MKIKWTKMDVWLLRYKHFKLEQISMVKTREVWSSSHHGAREETTGVCWRFLEEEKKPQGT